jgi:restriction system-associated AAA family ATPase
LERIDAKQFLPGYILGYSSGENEILSLPFYKMRFIYFDEYREMLLTESGYMLPKEGCLSFLDNDFSQAILLSNFLLQDKEILEPFYDELGIKRIKQFRIIIRKYILMDENKLQECENILQKYENNPEMIRKVMQRLFESREDSYGSEQKYLDITKSLKTPIQNLIKCSTTYYYDNDTDSYYLDYWVNDATKEAFKLYFGSAKHLFLNFQMLLILNLYSVSDKLKKELYESSSLYVNETVPVLASDERIMRFKDLIIQKRGVKNYLYSKSLSDGEHQFMHSLGLCLLFKDDNCLFLLDEPETHFNPDWRSKFISRLRDCFTKQEKATMREMLITTHTPFLISDSKPEYVLLFEKDEENNKVIVERPEFNTLGASINKITMEAFGKVETIGGYAAKKLKEFEDRFEAGEDPNKIIKETHKTLGDSVEKVLFINRVLDKGDGK